MTTATKKVVLVKARSDETPRQGAPLLNGVPIRQIPAGPRPAEAKQVVAKAKKIKKGSMEALAAQGLRRVSFVVDLELWNSFMSALRPGVKPNSVFISMLEGWLQAAEPIDADGQSWV